jgi:hypothetical protein
MAESLVALGLATVAGIGYVFSLERRIAVQQAEYEALKELLGVHLANIDKRLGRIEKKVLNGDA